MVVSGKCGRFVSKLIYSKKRNHSVRSRAGLHCRRGSRDIFAQPIDFGSKIVYICAVRILALLGHFIHSGGLSKHFPIRKPLGNCKFTTEMQNFDCFG